MALSNQDKAKRVEIEGKCLISRLNRFEEALLFQQLRFDSAGLCQSFYRWRETHVYTIPNHVTQKIHYNSSENRIVIFLYILIFD